MGHPDKCSLLVRKGLEQMFRNGVSRFQAVMSYALTVLPFVLATILSMNPADCHGMQSRSVVVTQYKGKG